MKLLGILICFLARKHLRGKYTHTDAGWRTAACPRCGRERKYKVRAK